VDVVIGPGRQEMLRETARMGIDLAAALELRGYLFLDRADALRGIDSTVTRVVDLWEREDFDLQEAVNHAIRILSRNPSGFFLMVESDLHGKNIKQDLVRTVEMDNIVKRTAEKLQSNTLILVTADHSFDLRLQPGSHTRDVIQHLQVVRDHTAEEVVAAAVGPGAHRIAGFLPNTELFHVMIAAYGWE
jgi:alkaline phosphatase